MSDEAPSAERARWRAMPSGDARADVWPASCGARDSRRDFAGHFRALVDLRGDDATHEAETSAQIEKDLPRVGGAFRYALDLRPGERDYRSLKRVLLAFVSHSPKIGYVQSMHSIAAFLLLAGLDEEDAFWCLTVLVSEIVPGYFDEGMAGAKLDQRVFARALREHLPAVGLHIGAIGPDDVVPAIVGGQWLLTLFVNVLPTRVTMELWDDIFRLRHRAPLLAACVALCDFEAQAVLATTEMGEAIELLQRCGERFRTTGESATGGEACGEEACDAFIKRVRELLSGDLSPDKVDQLTSRVRGRFRRPSDAGLPEVITSIAPSTDVDDLYVGLRSVDLQDKIATSTQGVRDRESAITASLQAAFRSEAISALNADQALTDQIISERGSGQTSTSSPPSSSLEVEEIDAVSEKLMEIEAHVSALAEHGDEVLKCVREIVLRPIRAIFQSHLYAFRKEIVGLHRDFVHGIQQLQQHIDRTLEIAPDLSVLPTDTYHKSMWPMWTKSLFEGTVELAEDILASLQNIRAELASIVNVFVGEQRRVDGPSALRMEEWEEVGEEIFTPEPDAQCLSASRQSHRNETQNRLNEIRAMIKRTHDEAVHDLPKFRRNLTSTTAKLKEELSSEEDAVNFWAKSAANRNVSKRRIVEEKLEQVGKDLLATYLNSHVGDSSDSETERASAKDGLERAFADEDKQLQNALQIVKKLESILTRRANVLEREKQTSESVRAISSRTLSQTNASLLLVYEAGEWLEHELAARSSDEFIHDYERLATLVEELSSISRDAFSRILREWCSFAGGLTSQVMLEYVSIIDSSSRAISDTQASLTASVNRLQQASPLVSPAGSTRELDLSHASSPSHSLRSLTSQMEKLTDIAGVKLGNFGNRLRKFAAHAPSGTGDQTHEGVAPASPGLSETPALSPTSRASRLVVTAQEDRAKLESRRSQLLRKKTWLREHLVAKGDA